MALDYLMASEMGIDGGGLFKEFITCLTKEVFNPDAGLWAQNDDGQLYPATSSYTKEGRPLVPGLTATCMNIVQNVPWNGINLWVVLSA